MTDVQSQLEANGLPTTFDSNADKPIEGRDAANAAATVANADIKPVSEVKQSVLPDVSTVTDSVASKDTTVVPESSPLSNAPEAETNGGVSAEHRSTEFQVNGNNKPLLSLSHDSEVRAASMSFTDSVVPSSIPSELPSSTAGTGSSLPAQTLPSDTRFSPDQAPTSDLRTAPHSDNLPPDAVAAIEEQKHQADNRADQVTAPAPAPAPVATDQHSAPSVAEANAIIKTGLPSPPPQSPPPAPEMSHATLPASDPVGSVSADASVPPLPETLVEPTPSPAVPVAQAEDTIMRDVSSHATAPTEPIPPESIAADTAAPKVAREREEDIDMEDEPSAKRIKTDEPAVPESLEFKIPEAPSTSTGPDSASIVPSDGDDAVTPSRLAHMKKVISNLKKSNASQHFRLPVDHVLLNIPTYPTVVPNPMDLGTIDNKLKKNEYTSVLTFIHDFELIVKNCIAFNGREHGVTQSAFKMQSSFNNQMQALPRASEIEPSKAEKKAMKLKTESIRAAPPRRQSVTTPASAKSPKSAAPSTPSFAPGPDGVPLIRRDSSIVDGRPKRAIVPPKRNSDFSGVRPKKKKYELQLRFCQEVLKEISSTKHWQINQYFTHPVDPVALNIPTYFQVIKKPMDLGTVAEKLNTNQYEKAKDFEEDVRMIFKNCYKFNPEGDYVNSMGHQLEELFDKKWAEKDDWINQREPHSEPSEAEEEEEEEASEEEYTDSEDDKRYEKIKALQAQIEAMSKQMGELTQSKKKKKTTPPAPKAKKTKTKKEKAPAQFPGLNKPKDKKKSKTKAEKERYVTFQEKQYISNGIGMLPEKQMQDALRIIQNSVPSLANNGDGEIELDIEEVPNHALLKLLAFVKKYAPPPPDELDTKADTYTAGPTKSKKNKPMSKQEQEAQIKELKGRIGAYADGGPSPPDTMQSVETGNDSSDDSADSEESEEE